MTSLQPAICARRVQCSGRWWSKVLFSYLLSPVKKICLGIALAQYCCSPVMVQLIRAPPTLALALWFGVAVPRSVTMRVGSVCGSRSRCPMYSVCFLKSSSVMGMMGDGGSELVFFLLLSSDGVLCSCCLLRFTSDGFVGYPKNPFVTVGPVYICSFKF